MHLMALGMRRQISSKYDSFTGSMVQDEAGISVKELVDKQVY